MGAELPFLILCCHTGKLVNNMQGSMIFVRRSFIPQWPDDRARGYPALGFWKGAHHDVEKSSVSELVQYVTFGETGSSR